MSEVLNKPLILPHVPEFVMKLILGELSELLLNGNYVSGQKLKETGFDYQYTDLKTTLEATYLD